MKSLSFIDELRSTLVTKREELSFNLAICKKLGFESETNRINSEMDFIRVRLNMLSDISSFIKSDSDDFVLKSELEKLQSEVFKIVGEGEVMELFNSFLGVNSI